MNILEIKNLSVKYRKSGKTISALRELFLEIVKGETIALVGESGCGKSTLALSLLKLICLLKAALSRGKYFTTEKTS